MSHTITAVIDKLRLWSAGTWRMYDTNSSKLCNYTLRIHFDQLFILLNNKVLESLNLNGRMKSIYKDDILILVIHNSLEQIRKIKCQIKTNIEECLLKLSLHFPVVNYNSINFVHHMKYKNVEEVLRTVLDGKGNKSGLPLPPSFTNFIKLCLLDPAFPQFVDETDKFLKERQ